MHPVISSSGSPLPLAIHKGKRERDEEGILFGIENAPKKVKISDSEENNQVLKIEDCAHEIISNNRWTLIDQKETQVLSAIFEAIKQKEWDALEQILEENPKTNLNATPLCGENAGKTIFWFLAHHKLWDLFRQGLKCCPEINGDASPLEGKHRGITLLWILARRKQWDLFREVWKQNQNANLQAAPLEGEYKESTVIWWFARRGEWNLFREAWKLYPNINFNECPAGGQLPGATIAWLIAWQDEFDLLNEVLEHDHELKLNFDAHISDHPIHEWWETKDERTIFWLLAWHQQWDLFRSALEHNPKIQSEKRPTDLEEGPDGCTVLWFLAFCQQWDLLREFLKQNPEVSFDFDASPFDEEDRGRTVLWLLARRQQWDLFREVLKRNPKVNVETAPIELASGDDMGTTISWLLIYYKKWDLLVEVSNIDPNCQFTLEDREKNKVLIQAFCAICGNDLELFRELLKLHPEVNFEVTIEKGRYVGAAISWILCFRGQWDFFEELVKHNPKININATPLKGGHQGKTVLWFLTHFCLKKRDLFCEVWKNNQDANFDAGPMKGEGVGTTVLWMLAFTQQWDLFSEALKLYPKLNFDAIYLYKSCVWMIGKSVLWLLADHKQWGLFNDVLKHDPQVNFDKNPLDDVENSVFWKVVQHEQWGLVRKMLEMKPQIQIDIYLLSPKYFAGQKFINILAQDKEDGQDKSALLSYLLLSDTHNKHEPLPPIGRERKVSILRTFNRIYISLDRKNNTSQNMFSLLPPDVIDNIALYVLNAEHPEFISFLPFSLKKFYEYEDREKNKISLEAFSATCGDNIELFREILELHPEVNFDFAIKKGRDAGVAISWILCFRGQWDFFKELVKHKPQININATPLEGGHQGKTVLWFLADRRDKNWDLFYEVWKGNQDANFDAGPMKGEKAGTTVLWMLAFTQQWDLFSEALKLYPKLNFDAICLYKSCVSMTGKSVLWLLADHKQWALFNDVLKHDPQVNFDKNPLDDVENSVFWKVVRHQQWGLVRKMLEMKPQIDIHAPSPKYFAGKKFIDIMTQDEEDGQEKSALLSYLLLSDTNNKHEPLPPIGRERRVSILGTFNRIYISLDRKNNTSQNMFSLLPLDVIDTIALYVLNGEHPELTSFLPLSLKKFYEYEDIYDYIICRKIALLVFRQFREQNKWSTFSCFFPQNLSSNDYMTFRNSVPKDHHDMIAASLLHFKKGNSQVEYTYENRKKIIQGIGKDQNTLFHLLDINRIMNSLAALFPK